MQCNAVVVVDFATLSAPLSFRFAQVRDARHVGSKFLGALAIGFAKPLKPPASRFFQHDCTLESRSSATPGFDESKQARFFSSDFIRRRRGVACLARCVSCCVKHRRERETHHNSCSHAKYSFLQTETAEYLIPSINSTPP